MGKSANETLNYHLFLHSCLSHIRFFFNRVFTTSEASLSAGSFVFVRVSLLYSPQTAGILHCTLAVMVWVFVISCFILKLYQVPLFHFLLLSISSPFVAPHLWPIGRSHLVYVGVGPLLCLCQSVCSVSLSLSFSCVLPRVCVSPRHIFLRFVPGFWFLVCFFAFWFLLCSLLLCLGFLWFWLSALCLRCVVAYFNFLGGGFWLL